MSYNYWNCICDRKNDKFSFVTVIYHYLLILDYVGEEGVKESTKYFWVLVKPPA